MGEELTRTKKKKDAPAKVELPVIVGIGSSAGGLEAIRELAASLPLDNGCAYVIVQHMSPQHKSLLTSLIATETGLQVVDIVDDTVPEPDVIYVTPPRADVIMSEGKLRLLPPSEDLGKPKPSVDRFLMSLSRDRGDKSMGIILSGTGSDGAYGIQAVREAGGITIAQDDSSAKYDGMPNAAIETGCVDLILRPSDIATHLKKIMSSPRNLDQFRADQSDVSPISGILQIVLARTRVDFREYKQSTVLRRIDRRMTALGIAAVEDYVSHCRNEPREVDALFKDLLISVTRFFRDQEEFEDLRRQIQDLVDKRDDRPLRIWVAGCATGEEVYTIAMMLAEAMGGPAELVKSKTQIFATDIDRAALDYARRARYSQGALLDVPKELADKYFVQQSEGIRVIEALRSIILFSDHNLCQDPPFLKMDLICCRNLMIYFSAKLQTRVFGRLHYALRQNGLLFLGTAETVTGAEDMFRQIDGNRHIFTKRAGRKKPQGPSNSFEDNWGAKTTIRKIEADQRAVESVSSERQMFDALARSLGKNSILVGADHGFLRVYGDVTPYVNLSEDSSLNLQLNLLKSPYREEARSLVTLALKHDQRRIGTKHSSDDGEDTITRLEAIPLKIPSLDEKPALLIINRWPKKEFEKIHHGPESGGDISEDHFRELDQELASTREALQQTIEELETSNEELQSLNEELQSTNEELQATNEEMETSNEELQSTNEELITVNEELQVNASELRGLNAELGSLLGNVPVPLLVLDNALQVARASHEAMQLFNISGPQRTPHLSQVHLPQGFPRLVEICNEALQLGETVSMDFETDGGPYTLQCAPFSGDAGQIIGTTLLFLRSPATQSLATELNQLLSKAPVFVLQYDDQGTVTRISERMAWALNVDRDASVGISLDELLEAAKLGKDHPMRSLLEGKPNDHAIKLIPEGETAIWLACNRQAYTDPGNGRVNIVTFASDVTTDILESIIAADISSTWLQLIEDLSQTGYWRLDFEDDRLYWSDRVFEIHGLDPKKDSPPLEKAIEAYHPDDRDMVAEAVRTAIENSSGFQFRARLRHADGRTIWVNSLGEVIKDATGAPTALIGSFRDVSSEKLTETRLAELETKLDTEKTGFVSYDVLIDRGYWSPSVYTLLKLDPEIEADFKHILGMTVKADRPRFKAKRQKMMTDGEALNDTFKLKSGDGTIVDMTLSMDVTRNKSGQVTNYFGTMKVNKAES
ncbi:MAG: CheR family methyltransferase [Pseudomonadota bacterium]